MMAGKWVIAALLMAALLLISACGSIELRASCESNADCKGGEFCIKQKCTAFSIYKDIEPAGPASQAQESRDPVTQGFDLCNNEDPLFDPRAECQKIRMTKFSDRSICDYAIGPPTWYNMGACYTCIVSCK